MVSHWLFSGAARGQWARFAARTPHGDRRRAIMSGDNAITPAERRVTDSAPAKEDLSLPLVAAPRVVRSLWPDVLCLVGAVFVPVLTMTGCLVLGWSIFGWGLSSDLALVASFCGVSLGACCVWWPLLRAPLGARVALLCFYVLLLSVVFSFVYFLFVAFDRFCSGLGG